MPKPGSPAKHWAFTLNNYGEEDEARLSTVVNTGGVSYIIYGKEVSSTGTPHLQGHVSLVKKTRLLGVVKLIGQAHLTVCRNIADSIEYCKKEGNYTSFGVPPNVSSSQGKRSDLDEFMSAVKGGMVNHAELREHHPTVMARYQRFALSYIRDKKPLPQLKVHALYAWQRSLLDDLTPIPHPRSIFFYVDYDGNAGKSYMCSYLEAQPMSCQVLKCGKRDDMAFALEEDRELYIIDVSRAATKFLSYQLIEDIKDGRVFSPKYESTTKRFNIPHVMVFMNEDPDWKDNLSKDRVVIRSIAADP